MSWLKSFQSTHLFFLSKYDNFALFYKKNTITR